MAVIHGVSLIVLNKSGLKILIQQSVQSFMNYLARSAGDGNHHITLFHGGLKWHSKSSREPQMYRLVLNSGREGHADPALVSSIPRLFYAG